jgi:hypothetical protein
LQTSNVRFPPTTDITAVSFPTHCGHDEDRRDA